MHHEAVAEGGRSQRWQSDESPSSKLRLASRLSISVNSSRAESPQTPMGAGSKARRPQAASSSQETDSSAQNRPSFPWHAAPQGKSTGKAQEATTSKLRPVRAPRRTSPFRSPSDIASPAEAFLMKVRGWRTSDPFQEQHGLAADGTCSHNVQASKRKLSALQAAPVSMPIPSMGNLRTQHDAEAAWREAEHWRAKSVRTQTEIVEQTVRMRELQTSLLQAQMASEKWRERAGQRTSLAQSNAELHGRLERANDRSQQQQRTIEHLQAEVRAGAQRLQELAGFAASKQDAVEEQAAHVAATIQHLQSAIATKDTLIADLQTRLMGREGAGEAVRASQEVHRESLLQECSGLRLQVGEGAVREIQLKAELEATRSQLQASAGLRETGAQELERRLCRSEERLIQAHAEAAQLQQQHKEAQEAANKASSCAAQTDVALVSEQQRCQELRGQLQQLSQQASRANALDAQLAEALQAHVQQKTAAEQQEGLISASLTELQGLQATASGLREAGSITEAELKRERKHRAALQHELDALKRGLGRGLHNSSPDADPLTPTRKTVSFSRLFTKSSGQLQHAQQHGPDLEQQTARATKEVAQLQGELTAAQQTFSQSQAQISDLQVRNGNLQEALQQAQSEAAKQSDERASQQIAELQAALAISAAERDEAIRLIEQERRQIDHLEHQLLFQADEEDALESRRLREALAESQAKEAALEAQEVNLRQQLYSAQGQTRLLHELQQKLCEDGAQLQELERDRADLEEQLEEKGSQQVLKFAQDLGLEEVKVKEVGCLGDCGMGPNMFLRPLDVKLNGMGTPARVTDLLKSVCSIDVPPSLLKATEKRLAGNREARDGNLEEAVSHFTQGLEADPPRGKHLLYANRSGANLALGKLDDALADANRAAECGPAEFSTAYIRQVEAQAAKGAYRAAEAALHSGGKRCPAFAGSSEFALLQKALDKQMAAAG
ncbi:hypothetical protein WJX84_002450 [Apatococcus fuscideae]|uniref:Uncharacterized protein n=1 Tax=Apatococcus fuscideae TaxID=2026836 RepID=A0AAW1SMZ3_9CHLO